LQCSDKTRPPAFISLSPLVLGLAIIREVPIILQNRLKGLESCKFDSRLVLSFYVVIMIFDIILICPIFGLWIFAIIVLYLSY